MKQKLLIAVALIFLVLLLVGLNAATYVQKEKIPDTEFAPNRSTYNSGTTGSQAFYALLAETGRNVERWQSPLDSIDTDSPRPAVFVLIGPLRRELSDVESTHLMRWVANGGTLVLIDRDPSSSLTVSTAQWKIGVREDASPAIYTVDAANHAEMTADTPAVKPSFPSFFTHGVNAVQPSRFASFIDFERFEEVSDSGRRGYTAVDSGPPPPPPPVSKTASPTPYEFRVDPEPSASTTDEYDYEYEDEDEEIVTGANGDAIVSEAATFDAPVVHIRGQNRNLLVEVPFAAGRVVVLSDPYIVSNAGISSVDNSRLAVNLVTSRSGKIAFDEYHHGHGANNNRLVQYFEGTPVFPLFVQFGLIIALAFFSQSRRFARPVPEPEPDRLSKLEYVSAMAELQQRTRAYDLAIENIYTDFRRRACSLVGLDNTTTTRRALAERIAERIGASEVSLEQLFERCEDAMYGSTGSTKETIELVDKLRGLEEKLGLRRAGRKRI